MKHHVFRNRQEAGEALAEHLDQYGKDTNAIVLGLPGGGLAVAAAVSDVLTLPLDVFISRRLQAPCHPECVLGALTETGVVYMDESTLCSQNWLYRELRAYVEQETESQEAEIARLRRVYRGARKFPRIAGRTVVLVDDGITSGATFIAAVDSLRTLGAASIIGALPAGPSGLLREMHYKVDELVALIRPENFKRLKDYYADFAEISDVDAAKLLTPDRQTRVIERPA